MTPKLQPAEHYNIYLGINGNDTIDYHSLLSICKELIIIQSNTKCHLEHCRMPSYKFNGEESIICPII